MTVEQIAKICHQANKAYCEAIGDTSQKDWEAAEEWQRESARKGVKFRLDNPTAPQSAQHEAWKADKIADGWKYGSEKNPETKEHPCLVDYTDLPEEQRLKDALFQAVVDSLTTSQAGVVSTITISASEYHSLNIAEAKLQALEGAGVDNWSGYEEAMGTLKKERSETQSSH